MNQINAKPTQLLRNVDKNHNWEGEQEWLIQSKEYFA